MSPAVPKFSKNNKCNKIFSKFPSNITDMNNLNFKSLFAPLLLLMITLNSCEAIAGIFKAGVWVGIVIVIVVIAIIFWIINKVGKK